MSGRKNESFASPKECFRRREASSAPPNSFAEGTKASCKRRKPRRGRKNAFGIRRHTHKRALRTERVTLVRLIAPTRCRHFWFACPARLEYKSRQPAGNVDITSVATDASIEARRGIVGCDSAPLVAEYWLSNRWASPTSPDVRRAVTTLACTGAGSSLDQKMRGWTLARASR